MEKTVQKKERFATENSCKVCAPLGACIALKGIEAAVPLLHGSQGCATYIRRYLIGHFREPVDIASSSFSEATAIFGGRDNLFTSLDNIIKQYRPKLIGIATTCLSETIGDDVALYVQQYKSQRPGAPLPAIVFVSTPSFKGSHTSGFGETQYMLVSMLCDAGGPRTADTAVFLPSLVSPADLRQFQRIFSDFGLHTVMIPDYSDTLDAGPWDRLEVLEQGGTKLDDIRQCGRAAAALEIGSDPDEQKSAGLYLKERFGVGLHRLCLPVGVGLTDRFFKVLETVCGRPTPHEHAKERSRLIDSYADGHKFVFGKRVAIVADTELLVGLASLCLEIGARPVVCASSDIAPRLGATLRAACEGLDESCAVLDDADFAAVADAVDGRGAECIISHSKGYALSKKLDIPLVRAGFPIQDRIGSQRLLHVCYAGTQQLFDRLVNAFIRKEQDGSSVGYLTY